MNGHVVLAVMQNIPSVPAKSVATVFAGRHPGGLAEALKQYQPVSLCAADAGECPVVLLDGNAIHALRLERDAEDDAAGIQLWQV